MRSTPRSHTAILRLEADDQQGPEALMYSDDERGWWVVSARDRSGGEGSVPDYVCSRCGEVHAGPPHAYDVAAPDYWPGEAGAGASAVSALTDELCVVEGRHFFVHGRVVLPVKDADEAFEWGVWASVSEASYRRIVAAWNDPEREREPPSFGWLSTTLPVYPPTLNLKTMVHSRPIGERPLVELEPTDHPLAVEQRDGITRARIQDIDEQVRHASLAPDG